MSKKSTTLLGLGLGNGIESYDWAIYATMTPFFANQIFHNTDPIASILSVLAIFAVGFLVRPLGGWLFGWIADSRGRRLSMMLAISAASIGSLLIAVTPSFEMAGILAPALLLIARVMQGLAHGGELPAAQTYLAEYAPAAKRGRYSSLIYVSITLGVLAGSILGALLSQALSKADMEAWGWRIPFFLGAALGLITLMIRRYMSETEAFQRSATAKAKLPLWPQLVKNRRQAIQVIGLIMGLTVSYYVWAISAPAFAASIGMDRGAALWASVVGNLVFIVALPVWGMLSDRWGRKPVLIFGGIGVLVLIFPMNALISKEPWTLAVSMSAVLLFMAAHSAIAPAVLAEMFPTGIRTTGVAIPYSIAVALFGGTAPYLQTWLNSLTHNSVAFSAYASILLVISLATVLTLKETRGISLSEQEPAIARIK